MYCMRLADLPIRTETGGPNNRTRLCCSCIGAILLFQKKERKKIFSERQGLNSWVCRNIVNVFLSVA